MLMIGKEGQITLLSLIIIFIIKAHLDVSELRSETVRAGGGLKYHGILPFQR